MEDQYCKSPELIKCPNCLHNHRMEVMEVPWNDDERKDQFFDSCGKLFQIRALINVKWMTTMENES